MILVQPLDETVPKGSTATFTVVASSTTTLSYQWYFGTRQISGATTATLTLLGVTYTNGGTYSVAVQNAGGTVNSRAAKLTVTNIVPVAVDDAYTTLENVGLNIAAPGVLANDLDADGDPLTAVLVSTVSHGSFNLQTNGGFTYKPSSNYFGIDSFTYRPSDGMATGNLATVVINITHVNQPPVANNQSLVVLSPGTTDLLVTATDVDSSNLLYAILALPLHGTLGPLDSKLGTVTYTPFPNYSGSDSFAFTAFDGSLFATGQVSLTVVAPPSIIRQPLSLSIQSGQNASFFSVASGTAPLNYQWQLNGAPLIGATNASLALTNVQSFDSGSYTVVVTNVAGSVTSTVATLTVYVGPAISAQPLSQTVTQGVDVTFSIAASGTAPLAYQWQFLGTNLPGATSSSLILTNLQLVQAGNYQVTVTNPWGAAVSAPAFLGVISWMSQYSGSQSNGSFVQASAVDAQGNVYVTGYAGMAVSKSQDYVTIKYDPFGNLIWLALYSNPVKKGSDKASALALDAAGNVYVTGASQGQYSLDYATVKYDTNGNQLWVARYDGAGAGDDLARAVAVDTNGNVFVTGSSINAAGKFQYATVKYDNSGNQLWVRTYVGPAATEDDANSIALDPGGNVYVTGQSQGNGSDFDYATIKYASDGTQLWVSRYNGPGNLADSAVQVVVDGSGNSYVTGSSTGISTNFDYATVKYDGNGKQMWVARYDGPAGLNDKPAALALDADGNVIVTGASEASPGISDYATVKYSPLGSPLWVQRYDFGDDDQATALALDPSGDVYVTGKSKGPTTGYDFATIRYRGLDGTQISVQRYNSSGNLDDTAATIAVDSQSNVYVAGQGFNPIDYVLVKYQSSFPAPTLSVPVLSGPVASNKSSNSALLSANVDSQGTPGICWFQYGLTTNYGSSSLLIALAAGTNPVAVSTTLTGLMTGTVYHCRIVATNAGGMTVGQDLTFTTPSIPLVQLSGSSNGSVQLFLTNVPGAIFFVLSSTDLSLPVAYWHVVGAMTETSPGIYRFTDPQPSTNSPYFYRISLP